MSGEQIRDLSGVRGDGFEKATSFLGNSIGAVFGDFYNIGAALGNKVVGMVKSATPSSVSIDTGICAIERLALPDSPANPHLYAEAAVNTTTNRAIPTGIMRKVAETTSNTVAETAAQVVDYSDMRGDGTQKIVGALYNGASAVVGDFTNIGTAAVRGVGKGIYKAAYWTVSFLSSASPSEINQSLSSSPLSSNVTNVTLPAVNDSVAQVITPAVNNTLTSVIEPVAQAAINTTATIAEPVVAAANETISKGVMKKAAQTAVQYADYTGMRGDGTQKIVGALYHGVTSVASDLGHIATAGASNSYNWLRSWFTSNPSAEATPYIGTSTVQHLALPAAEVVANSTASAANKIFQEVARKPVLNSVVNTTANTNNTTVMPQSLDVTSPIIELGSNFTQNVTNAINGTISAINSTLPSIQDIANTMHTVCDIDGDGNLNNEAIALGLTAAGCALTYGYKAKMAADKAKQAAASAQAEVKTPSVQALNPNAFQLHLNNKEALVRLHECWSVINLPVNKQVKNFINTLAPRLQAYMVKYLADWNGKQTMSSLPRTMKDGSIGTQASMVDMFRSVFVAKGQANQAINVAKAKQYIEVLSKAQASAIAQASQAVVKARLAAK